MRNLSTIAASVALLVAFPMLMSSMSDAHTPTHPGLLPQSAFTSVSIPDSAPAGESADVYPVAEDIQKLTVYVMPTIEPEPTDPVADRSAAPSPAPAAKPPSEPTVADAKAYALKRLGPIQYACIDKIFTRESHWNPKALNKSSGAFGIPQSLPAEKMKSAGSDWRTNPVTQVRWGIRYANVRYGGACNALAHSNKFGWY